VFFENDVYNLLLNNILPAATGECTAGVHFFNVRIFYKSVLIPC